MRRKILRHLIVISIAACVLAGCGSRACGDEAGENVYNTQLESSEDFLDEEKKVDTESEQNSNEDAENVEGPEGLPTPALDTWGVTLSVKDVTPEGLTIVCTQSRVTPSGELNTGTYYILERKESDVWIPVADILEDTEVGWDAVAWSISMGSMTEWQVDWEWLYGSLAPGHYRIGKEIMNFRGTGDYDKEMYYAEFEIEN